MPDDWDSLPNAAPGAKGDEWDSLPNAGPQGAPDHEPLSGAALGVVKDAVEPVLNAFGQGFREGWGPERLGLSPDSVKWLSKTGIFAPEGQARYQNPFHAFNELLAETIWTAPEILFRGANAMFRGGQAAVAQIGEEAGQPQLGRDIAAIPEAFFGSPHPLGIPGKSGPQITVRAGEMESSGIVETAGVARETVDLPAARDLGVIGPEKPPISEGTPVEAAQAAVPPKDATGAPRNMAADQKRPDTVTQEVGEGTASDKAGNIRLDLIDKPEDVLNIIRQAAEEQGGADAFMPARKGEIPLAQVDALSQATGIAPGDLDVRGMGRLMRNDNEVRSAIQAMIQSAEDTAGAMKKAALTDSPEDLIEFQRLRMRHSVLQEQVAGLTAEWGRTGNVFQEFSDRAKDAKGLGEFLKEKKGETVDDLRDMARAGSALDPRTQLPAFLNDMRKPTAWDKFMYYWVNSLISGPITHVKYIVANATFAGYESGIVTPIAGVIGASRRAVTGTREGVYVGEAAARLWGVVAGTPDAIIGAARAAKSGMQTALPGEVAQNLIPKQQKSLAFQQKPIEGKLGAMIGLPSRGASAIHSFFNFLGYRASMEAQAYRSAAKEGLHPVDDAFWQRRADKVANPTPDMMNEGIEEGYRLTYISELSPTAKAITSAIKKTKAGQLILPFLHIPFNILARGLEGTPAAFLSAETRDSIFGRSGPVKQDMAIARLVAGASVGAWAVNAVANDRMTGFGPTDPKERAQWLTTGHQPYSIRIGDYWYSFNRFGSLGTMLGLYANLAEAIPHIKPDNEELLKALTMTVHATGRLMEDEVGMQGLAGLMEAINEPERKGTRFLANFAGSLLPYSSAQRQVASAMDPEMREAKTLTDGLRYYIPAVREGLLPKRDWTGSPIANAGYGGDVAGAPGLSAIIQHRQVNGDPVDQEMHALNLHPAPPSDRIGGVKLTPALYDKYQSTAGPFTRQTLENYVRMPGWYDMPPFVREETFRNAIKNTRAMAGAAMQAKYPQIIQQGIDNKVGRIKGEKPGRLQP